MNRQLLIDWSDTTRDFSIYLTEKEIMKKQLIKCCTTVHWYKRNQKLKQLNSPLDFWSLRSQSSFAISNPKMFCGTLAKWPELP